MADQGAIVNPESSRNLPKQVRENGLGRFLFPTYKESDQKQLRCLKMFSQERNIVDGVVLPGRLLANKDS